MAIEGIKSYYEENKTRYYVATEEQCEKIIMGALTILEKTGMVFKHPRAVEILKNGGCKADGERVWFPPEVVKKAISTAPKEVVLYDRFGNEAIRAGGTANYYGMGPTNPCFNDFETGERRPVLKSDVARSAKVGDALPNIDFIMSLAGITDCNPKIADVCEMHEMLQNTTKPIVGWGVDVHGVKDELEMCAAVAGGWDKLLEKPFIAMYAGDPVTPLTIPVDAFEKLEYCAQKGIAIIWPSGAQLGSTAPVTIAGAITLGLAENLAALVLSQLINEDTPFVGGVVILTVDMITTMSAYGSPEHCLGESIIADIYHYLNLPLWGTGGVTDSKVVDEQAAIETSMQVLSTALSGCNLVHDVGFMDSAISGSLEQIVLSDEIIGYARRIVRGVEINDNTLALDVIDEVGPAGEFLTHVHTFKNFKNELWMPTLIDRSPYQKWEVEKKDMNARIREKTVKILEEHQVPALPAHVVKELDDILAFAKKRIGE